MPDNTQTLPDTSQPAPDQQISLRMPAALLAQIDAAARDLNVNRAALIRMTLTTALRTSASKGE